VSGPLGARRVRELLDEHGVRPRKELGQNFVIDPNTIRKIVDAAGVRPGDHVVEIGAGTGSLTLGLAAVGARVTAIEFDRRLLPALDQTTGGNDFIEVVAADAIRFDFARVGPAQIVANLPYNIAVPVVMRILESAPNIDPLTIMTQREVGERLAARPGSKAYGAVSVMVACLAEAAVLTSVSRRAFYPVPSVDSVIVRVARRAEACAEPGVLRPVVRAAFSQRRKTLRNTLTALSGGEASVAEAAIRRAGIDPGARAEDIDVGGFVALAREFA
jgi:16S rRNA (adenine1518-N6/adenine1519-N6)-dimethyltransferase